MAMLPIRHISVPVLDDALIEGDEFFRVDLFNPVGGAVLVDYGPTVTIHDDEVNPSGEVGFTVTSTRVAETLGSVAIHVTRTGGTSNAITVAYQINDVEALAGVDYTATSNGTLSWAAGDANDQVITIVVTNDLIAEGDETFRLTLSTPTGGATLGRDTSTVTIADPATPAARRKCGLGGVFSLMLMMALWLVVGMSLRSRLER